MLSCLCNNCCLFLSSQVTPILVYMAHLLNDEFTAKIDRFTNSDGDRQIGFESIFTIHEPE